VRFGSLTHYFGSLYWNFQNNYYWVIIVRARLLWAGNNQKIKSIIGINSACFLLSGINVWRYLVHILKEKIMMAIILSSLLLLYMCLIESHFKNNDHK